MRLLPAALAACLVTSPVLAREPDGPACLTANAAMAAVAQHPDAMAGRLDGAEAADLLSSINAVGEPTSYHAQTIIVVPHEDRAVVGMFDACHTGDIAMPLGVFAEVWRSVRGQPT